MKKKHKVMIEELKTWRDKVKCLDTERLHQEETLTRFKTMLQTQKVDNETMRAHLEKLANIEEEYDK